LRIAVNTRLLLKNKLEGIGWFSYESLKRICTQHPEHEFFFIFDRKWSDDFIFSDNITPVSIAPQARHPLLYYLWFEHSIPGLLRKIKPDLFFSPDGYLSLSTNVKSVNVFHDLNFEHYPMDVPRAERLYYRRFFPKYAQKAARIATVSEYSKQDIVKIYGVNPDKIDVVYNGANINYKPMSGAQRQETINQYSSGNPYFVFVGALHPRKNLVNLFKAYDIFRKHNPEPVNLLIVGAKMWWTKAIEQAYNKMVFKNDVIFTGRLDTSELNKVLGSALALTYVSYFEGFGIPIVEAFYCDTPVITSNVTSMPEVAGDAALLINPFSPNSIAEAMQDIASSKDLRNELILKGRKRREQFSWQQTADRLWGTIEKVLG
jgi:glycosyltransferase involved in cell wall biosynthesis